MKVGDMVKYKSHIMGKQGLIGIIVSENGQAFDVFWYNYQGGKMEVDFPDFLEVIGESR